MKASLSLFLLLGSPAFAADRESIPNFCDPHSADFRWRQHRISWHPVAPERIAEPDYHGRVFEARVRDAEAELFAYKVLMNIRGHATYASVALLDQEQSTIDVKSLAVNARMLVQDEARKVAGERGLKETFVSLSNNFDIALWSSRSGTYFTVDTSERASVFEIEGNTVRYVCTYEQGRRDAAATPPSRHD